MVPGQTALAIHVCADATTRGVRKTWPPAMAAMDTLRRARRICQRLGIVEQRQLTGAAATADALLGALREARYTLADGGVLALTFCGHTERGDGPIESAQWCMVDGGVALSQLAGELALLPPSARLLIICDSCHASAIAEVLAGPQRAIVIASCGHDQVMLDRLVSEFIVRLERFVSLDGPPFDPAALFDQPDELHQLLAADTPDCERPLVWSSAIPVC